MIKKILVLFILTAAIFSCNNSDKKKIAVTDRDVANAFVRGLLDNDFNEAEQYLYKDETNTQIFERFKKQYIGKDKATLEKYKKADILVHEATVVIPDSIFIYKYSNSYSPADKTVLKLVRIDNKWLVDLKYTFSGNL